MARGLRLSHCVTQNVDETRACSTTTVAASKHKKGIEMVATLKKSNIARSETKPKTAEAFLMVSRLGDLKDDATMDALRRAAEIRKAWSKAEVAKRKQVGQQRFSELKNLLAFGN